MKKEKFKYADIWGNDIQVRDSGIRGSLIDVTLTYNDNGTLLVEGTRVITQNLSDIPIEAWPRKYLKGAFIKKKTKMFYTKYILEVGNYCDVDMGDREKVKTLYKDYTVTYK